MALRHIGGPIADVMKMYGLSDMTPLQSAILDLVTSCRGDDEPLDVLLAELRIRPEFKDVPLWAVDAACIALAMQNKIWYAGDVAKLRHHETKPEQQRRLF